MRGARLYRKETDDRDFRHLPGLCWRQPLGSDIQQKIFAFPRADYLKEGLCLTALDLGKQLYEILAKCFMQRLGTLKLIQRDIKITWQRCQILAAILSLARRAALFLQTKPQSG